MPTLYAPTAFDMFNKKSAADLIAREMNPLNATLEAVIRKMGMLAERLAKLEAAVSVGADGSVSIASPGVLALVARDRVIIGAPGRVQLECGSNLISLEPGRIGMYCGNTLEVATSKVNVNAGTVNLNAAMTKTAGTVQCDTMIANSVVGSSYTPGAGNIW
jgi:NACalpha-BTF3-like transcription factor